MWSPTTIDWPVPDDSKIDFYAYTDGSFIYNGGNPYVSFTMDENAFHQKDFLVATHKQIAYSDEDGKVSLVFDHACAAVQFQICQTKTITNQGHSFNINSVVLKNVCKSGDYYYDGGWTLGSSLTDLTLTNSTLLLTTDYQLLPCQWLFLVPQSQDAIQLEVKYTVDEGAEKTKHANLGTGSWENGVQHTINIRVGSSFLD